MVNSTNSTLNTGVDIETPIYLLFALKIPNLSI